MRLGRLHLIALLAGTMSVLGCGDDETSNGTGGTGGSAATGGTGGSAATGGTGGSAATGGTGGTGGSGLDVCKEGVCGEDTDKEDACRLALAACIEGPASEEDCVAALLAICKFDGTGGTGGTGGAPDANLLCAQGECEEDEQLETQCTTLALLCVENKPNDEECVIGVALAICGPP